MNRVQVLAAVLVVGLVSPVGAVTIDYDTIISAENSFPGEYVQVFDGDSPPTVVQMIDGGEAAQINVNEYSILNFFGGTIEFGLHGRNESQVNILNGTIPNLTVRDNASANIFGGIIESEVRMLSSFSNSAALNIFDGLIRGNVNPDAIGGILNIHGGHMGSLFGLGGGSTVVNITGGSLELFRVDGATTVHWSGGDLRSRLGSFVNDSVLNVYGYDLALEDLGRDKFLSGTLLDGTNVNGYFFQTFDNSQIILHNVPEPASLGLAVMMVAALLIRRGADRLKPFLAPRLLALALLAGFAAPVGAVTIDYDTIISAENSFPGEVVYIEDGDSPPTVVQMIDGGEAQSIALSGESILNFYGGHVAERVSAWGTSTINIRDGRIGSLYFSRSSALCNIFGGTIDRDVTLLSGLGSPTLNVFGGHLSDVVAGSNNSEPFTLNIHAGYMNWIRVRSSTTSSVVNITGGSFGRLSPQGTAIVHWSGGELRARDMFLWDESTLNIYGRNLALREDFGSEYLSGVLLDGTVLEDIYVDRITNAQVILHNIPEPATFGLAVMMVAALLIRRGAGRLKPFLAPRLLALALLAGFATPVGAVTIDYDTIISAENSFPGETVLVERSGTSPTVVQMIEGGVAGAILLQDDSVLNFHGGTIERRVVARFQSHANILEGTIPALDVQFGATANVFRATITGDINISGSGSSTLNVFGGEMQDVIARSGTSHLMVNIHGGRVGSLTSRGPIEIFLTGGSLADMAYWDTSNAHWSGGELRSPYFVFLNDDAVLHIYGSDLRLDPLDGSTLEGTLSGRLLDGTDITGYRLLRQQSNNRIVFHNVPEPQSLGLAAVAVVAVLVCGGRFGVGD